MKLKRLAVSTLTVVAMALGLGLVLASPAAAASGSWKPYPLDVNPISSSGWTWVCGGTREIENSVYAQVCAIREYTSVDEASSRVRVGVIVLNNRNRLYGAEAAGQLDNWRTGAYINRWICSRSGVGPRSRSVCFGGWIDNSPNDKVIAKGGVNGVNLPQSQQV